MQASIDRIVAAANECVHAVDFTEPLTKLVQDLSQNLDSEGPLDLALLRRSGADDQLIARLLRTIQAESIEVMRAELDGASFRKGVLALRQCIRKTMPRLSERNEKVWFYDQLVAGEQTGNERLLDFFQSVMLALRDMLFIHDMSGDVLYMNDFGLALVKYESEDVQEGLSIYDLVIPEYTDLIEARLESPSAAIFSPYSIELYAKDGERIPVEITSHPMSDGDEVRAIMCVARDLRLERRLGDAVQRTSKRLEALQEGLPMGVLVVDDRLRIVEANRASASALGAPDAGVLLGMGVAELMENGEELHETLQGALETRAASRQHFVGRTSFGKNFRGEVTAIPLDGDKAALDGGLVLLSTGGDQTRVQENLLKTERLSALGKIIAGVAHELNNPLTGILGYAQLLNSDELTEGQRKRLDHIAGEASRCKKIVESLMSFSHRSADGYSANDINKLVTEVLVLLEYQLRVDGIELVKDLDPGLPLVTCDIHGIRRALLNLVINAHDALKKAEPGKRRLTVRTSCEEDTVQIVVADSGPGIPEEIRLKVFDPFFSTKNIGDGAGLGLSVSYGVVRDHGGDIVLESIEGKGATFTVTLPLTPPDSNRPSVNP